MLYKYIGVKKWDHVSHQKWGTLIEHKGKHKTKELNVEKGRWRFKDKTKGLNTEKGRWKFKDKIKIIIPRTFKEKLKKETQRTKDKVIKKAR